MLPTLVLSAAGPKDEYIRFGGSQNPDDDFEGDDEVAERGDAAVRYTSFLSRVAAGFAILAGNVTGFRLSVAPPVARQPLPSVPRTESWESIFEETSRSPSTALP